MTDDMRRRAVSLVERLIELGDEAAMLLTDSHEATDNVRCDIYG